jgi:predicted solute-binding protein
VEVALLPTIALQQTDEPLTVIPAACVSTCGPALSPRIYSQVPPDEIRTLWADMESCSSVMLAKVLWAENYRRLIRVVPFAPAVEPPPEDADAVLLIGDKPVADPPLGFDWQVDLGAMWNEMTGLPFVLSVWAAVDGADCPSLFRSLSTVRIRNQRNLRQIACRLAGQRGWPETWRYDI